MNGQLRTNLIKLNLILNIWIRAESFDLYWLNHVFVTLCWWCNTRAAQSWKMVRMGWFERGLRWLQFKMEYLRIRDLIPWWVRKYTESSIMYTWESLSQGRVTTSSGRNYTKLMMSYFMDGFCMLREVRCFGGQVRCWMRQGKQEAEAHGHEHHKDDDLEGFHFISKCMIHISSDICINIVCCFWQSARKIFIFWYFLSLMGLDWCFIRSSKDNWQRQFAIDFSKWSETSTILTFPNFYHSTPRVDLEGDAILAFSHI